MSDLTNTDIFGGADSRPLNPANGIELLPQFIEFSTGNLFLTLYRPVENVSDEVIVLLPPFAEELNKSRRQINLQARQWCLLGYSVAVLDLLGTGDSQGEFADASVTNWQQNLQELMQWLQQLGYARATLWGIRFGCLLAPGLAEQSVLPVKRVILWQPVVQGKQTMVQFLRIRTAAQMMGSGAGETLATLQQQLSDGQSIEVAGYELSAKLYQEVLALNLAQAVWSNDVSLHWFQIGLDNQTSLPPVAAKTLQAWASDDQVRAGCMVGGDQFWATTEIAIAPMLIQESTELLCEPSIQAKQAQIDAHG